MSSPSVQPTLTPNDIATLKALSAHLTSVRLADRARLGRELDRLFTRRTRGTDFDRAVASVQSAIANSAAVVENLRALPLKLDFDPGLPISAHRDEIVAAMEKHAVIVVAGATGSGKTTQLPKMCLAAGRGARGLIGHTQPRRIAARAIASRLATELGTSVGGAVGYQVRFNDRTGSDCRVKLMTDGILLKELEGDRNLLRYDTLIIDEAHERSLNIDLLLGVLKDLLARRQDLKLIITSATIDPEKFASFFVGGAPVIEVSGRSYPVEVRYRPLVAEDEDATALSLPEGIVTAVRELDSDARSRAGDVLVFLPGEKQIREAADALSDARLRNTEILPLYARLSTREQERIFEGHSARRVVLATNVAETSLTVPGIRYVIDSGLARIGRYSVRGKVQRLPIERISKASADQRKGRCGREAEGICIRLFSEEDFMAREDFTPPEVLRTNLASVILQLAASRLGDPETFPFLDPPDTRQLNDGYRLLQELKAVDEQRKITGLGRQIAMLPLDPRLARMLVAAGHHGCVSEMLVIAAFLSIQDSRERPADAQRQADEAHATYADARSDFVTVLNLWNLFAEQSQALSGNQLRKWCRDRFLSFVRMREWQELKNQLEDIAEDLHLKPNSIPAQYAELHQAVLTGFLGSIGMLDESREYLGPRGTRFVIAPGTPLAGKPPKWIVAGSLLETTRIYARMVAAIEPQWIEAAGAHLLKRSYIEPHWVDNRGFVAAFETISIYGLPLASRRRVNYGSVAPEEAREIFAREALVEGHTQFRADFLKHNGRLRQQVEVIEATIRRRDVLVDEQSMVDFYVARLPPHVNSVAALERFLKMPSGQSPAPKGQAPQLLLQMSLRDLMRRDVPEASPANYPDIWRLGKNELPLTYRFEPGASDDGITMTVPEPLVRSLRPGELAWLVPGMLLEKVTAMLRALPKHIRKSFVPVPEHALKACAEIDASGDFFEALAQWITRVGGESTTAEQLMGLVVPDYLRFNIRIVDLDGKVITQTRDVGKANVAVTTKQAQGPRAAPGAAQSNLSRSWDFGDLPETREVERGRLHYIVYPAIDDRRDAVTIVDARTGAEAEAISRAGVLRLAILTLPQLHKFARKMFADHRDLVLLAQGLTLTQPLPDALAHSAFRMCFMADDQVPPRTRVEFETLLDKHRDRCGDCVEKTLALALDLLKDLRNVRQRMASITSPALVGSLLDVRTQLEQLLPHDFITRMPQNAFANAPRYLKAIARRLERLPTNARRDVELMQQLQPATLAWRQLSERAGSRITPELDALRWMLEEFRVSLYAQDLKTAIPVSAKRLELQLEKAKTEAAKS